MYQVSYKLGRASGICTSVCRLALFSCNLTAAGRTFCWKHKVFPTLGVLLNSQNLGNYLSRFSYNYKVAHTDIFFFYKILVVKHGTAYGSSRKAYRLKYSNRCKNSGSAHIYLYFQKLCSFLFRRIFVCLSPFRKLCGTSQKLSYSIAVHLYNSSVNSVRQTSSQLTYSLDFIYNAFYIAKFLIKIGNRKSKGFQIVKAFLVTAYCLSLNLLYIENKNTQISLCGYSAVFLSQRACGGISRVFKGFFLIFFLLLYKSLEAFGGHIHLASHLQELRSVFNSLWKIFDCKKV